LCWPGVPVSHLARGRGQVSWAFVEAAGTRSDVSSGLVERVTTADHRSIVKDDGNRKGTIPLTGGSKAEAWPWPDDLDAMIAAPEFHTVLFEDNRVRVLDGRVPPGATVPVHTHRWGGVLYILATSDFVRRDPDGNVLADTRASKSTPTEGTAVWGAPLTPHSLENVGSEEFRTLTVEMKDGSYNTQT
jgi:quercetin dioxygenase-like cupin family protein